MHSKKRKPVVHVPSVLKLNSLPMTTTQHEAEKKVEELPSVEWGERLNSGKTIARGGKTTGHVPGASTEHSE